MTSSEEIEEMEREQARLEHAQSDADPERVRFPEITVQLVGTDASVPMLLGRVTSAMKRSRLVSPAEISEFRLEALAGDYDHVLATIQRWVNVE